MGEEERVGDNWKSSVSDSMVPGLFSTTAFLPSPSLTSNHKYASLPRNRGVYLKPCVILLQNAHTFLLNEAGGVMI